MAETITPQKTQTYSVPSSRISPTLWQRAALAAILLLSLFLNFFLLGASGYGILYYAAAVKSMSMSWHNFFFVSFDPSGFITADKPPLALWLQVLSVKIFGFQPFSIFLPQTIAGVLSVALLYYIVKRVFGPNAGLLAALVLALTPICIATNRNNNSDSFLAFIMLLAAWALSIATEKRSLRWLLLSAVFVGLGFNTKMLEAYLILPALGLTYLLGVSLPWKTRVLHLACATVVLLVVSLCWVMAVDLTPPSQRPFVVSSSTPFMAPVDNNSEFSLAFGSNGLGRIFGTSSSATPAPATPQASPPPGILSFPGGETGNPGPLRLLSEQLIGQVSWFLLIALLGIAAVLWQTRPRLPLEPRLQAIVLWGVWLVTVSAVLSFQVFIHPYYLVTLAPAVSALVGIGLTTMWQGARSSKVQRWLLLASLAGTALIEVDIFSAFPDWSRWLTPLVVGVVLLATIALLYVYLVRRRESRLLFNVAATCGLVALFIAPMIWNVVTITNPNNQPSPTGGPVLPGNPFPVIFAQQLPLQVDPALLHYVQVHHGQETFLLATLAGKSASAFIVETGDPVMALGGFRGDEHIVTVQQITSFLDQGAVRYFLVPPLASSDDLQPTLVQWVDTHCSVVPPASWQSKPLPNVPRVGDGSQLFDCASRH